MEHKGYKAGCQCERCALARQRSREYKRVHPDKDYPERRPYKTAKQREYKARQLAEHAALRLALLMASCNDWPAVMPP